MSASLTSRLARQAFHKATPSKVHFNVTISSFSPLTGVRSLATHSGPWPGPNPLKDIFLGLSLGLVFAIGFKSWQIKDKAERVRFYQEYERANRVEEALLAKKKAAQPKEEEEQEEEQDEEEEQVDVA